MSADAHLNESEKMTEAKARALAEYCRKTIPNAQTVQQKRFYGDVLEVCLYVQECRNIIETARTKLRIAEAEKISDIYEKPGSPYLDPDTSHD